MAISILNNENKILPCALELKGEYGLSDIVFGVPVKLGTGGVTEVVEVPLSDGEKANLDKSAESVRKGIDAVR